MRPIDADALIARLEEDAEQMENIIAKMFTYGAINDIKHEPTITVPQWISVTERLPEEDGNYLTTTTFGEVYCDFWNGIYFNRTELVIAWMPLPEPYKERQDDNS